MRFVTRGASLRLSILLVLACSSGIAGLVYEVLYLRALASFVFGEVYYVAASILLAVFCGLALGAFFARRLTPYLWLIEGFLGLYSLSFALCARYFGAAMFQWMPVQSFWLWESVLAFFLVFVPFFFVGVSVPCFTWLVECFRNSTHSRGSLGHSQRKKEDSSYGPTAAFALVYALYNLFAAGAVLLAEYYLARSYGISAAILMGACVNLLIAPCLFYFCRSFSALSPKNRTNQENRVERQKGPSSQNALLIYAFLFLGTAFGLWHIFYLDFVWSVFGPYQESFALVVSSAIFGIALGSALALCFPKLGRFAVPAAALGFLCFVLGASHSVDLWVYLVDEIQKGGVHMPKLEAAIRSSFIILLGLPVFTLLGAAFPLLVRLDATRNYGRALGFSSLGNALGVLAASVFFRGYFEAPENASAILTALALALAFTAFKARKKVLCGALGLLAVSLLYPVIAFIYPTKLLSTGSSTFNGRRDFYDIIKEEVKHGVITVTNLSSFGSVPIYLLENKSRNGKSLVHAGHRVFGLGDIRGVVQREMAHLAAAAGYAPRTQRVYQAALGSGMSARGAVAFFDHSVIVDIYPAMLKVVKAFSRENARFLSRKNMEIVFQDALVDLSRRKEKFDAIVNTISSPLYFSAAKLYSVEFYSLAAARLNPGGVYLGWSDIRSGVGGIAVIHQSLKQSFSYCRFFAFNPAYYLHVCSNRPLVPQKHARRGSLGRDFRNLSAIEIPESVFEKTERVNTLERPVLSYAPGIVESPESKALMDRVRNALYGAGVSTEEMVERCCRSRSRVASSAKCKAFRSYRINLCHIYFE